MYRRSAYLAAGKKHRRRYRATAAAQRLRVPVVGVPLDRLGVDVPEVSDAGVARVVDELRLEHVDELLDAVGAVDVGVHEGAAEADGADAQGEELDDVGAVADAAVGVDLELLEDLGGFLVDLEGDLEGRGGAVDLAAAVVGEPDGVGAVLDGLLRLLDRLDALDDDGQLGHALELLVHVPRLQAEAGVGRARAVALGAGPDAVGGRVDGPDDGLGPGGVGAVVGLLVGRVVARQVDLAEEGLVVLGGDLANLLDC